MLRIFSERFFWRRFYLFFLLFLSTGWRAGLTTGRGAGRASSGCCCSSCRAACTGSCCRRASFSRSVSGDSAHNIIIKAPFSAYSKLKLAGLSEKILLMFGFKGILHWKLCWLDILFPRSVTLSCPVWMPWRDIFTRDAKTNQDFKIRCHTVNQSSQL